ncbi:hypothetical protein INT45_003466 [Circinella minor]|uniref:Velvet domain-containing protein n=1 Tax=Circinella minor TaxID=1195481 RepID=A0A8H7S6I1_9FUNG|nr:hypothetical protein INT45_003466 [Circinella minor]
MTHTPPGNAPLPVSTHPLEYSPVTLDGYSSQHHLRHENESIIDTTINDDPDYSIPLPPLQELLQTTMPTTTTETALSHQHQLANEDAQQPVHTTHGTHSFENSFIYNLSIATPATAFVGCSSSNDNQQKTERDNTISRPLLNNVIKMTETPYSSSSSISPSTLIPIDPEVSSSSTTTMTPTKKESGSMNIFRGYRSKSMRVKRSDQVRAMMGEVPRNMPSLLSNYTFIDSANKYVSRKLVYILSFRLTVVEQPKSCRVTGFSNSSDRRPIDPTPIVHLSVTDNNQRIDQESLQNPFYVLHVSLASVDKTKQYDVIVNYPRFRSSNSSITDEATAAAAAAVTTTVSKDNNRSRASSSSSSSSSVGAEIVTSFSDMTSTVEQQQSISTSSFMANEDSITLEQHQLSPSASEEEISMNTNQAIRVLVGPLVSSASTFKGLDDKLGIYFAFPGLSVRVSGTYRLHFSLLSLGRSDKVLAEEYSEPFTVYKAKSFPGMEGMDN